MYTAVLQPRLPAVAPLFLDNTTLLGMTHPGDCSNAPYEKNNVFENLTYSTMTPK